MDMDTPRSVKQAAKVLLRNLKYVDNFTDEKVLVDTDFKKIKQHLLSPELLEDVKGEIFINSSYRCNEKNREKEEKDAIDSKISAMMTAMKKLQLLSDDEDEDDDEWVSGQIIDAQGNSNPKIPMEIMVKYFQNVTSSGYREDSRIKSLYKHYGDNSRSGPFDLIKYMEGEKRNRNNKNLLLERVVKKDKARIFTREERKELMLSDQFEYTYFCFDHRELLIIALEQLAEKQKDRRFPLLTKKQMMAIMFVYMIYSKGHFVKLKADSGEEVEIQIHHQMPICCNGPATVTGNMQVLSASLHLGVHWMLGIAFEDLIPKFSDIFFFMLLARSSSTSEGYSVVRIDPDNLKETTYRTLQDAATRLLSEKYYKKQAKAGKKNISLGGVKGIRAVLFGLQPCYPRHDSKFPPSKYQQERNKDMYGEDGLVPYRWRFADSYDLLDLHPVEIFGCDGYRRKVQDIPKKPAPRFWFRNIQELERNRQTGGKVWRSFRNGSNEYILDPKIGYIRYSDIKTEEELPDRTHINDAVSSAEAKVFHRLVDDLKRKQTKDAKRARLE